MRLIDADAIDVGDISCSYGENCRLEDVQELIDDQPTIDVKPRHGTWIKYLSIYRCSNCGSPKSMKKPYCQICGACMDGTLDNTQCKPKFGEWEWESGYVGTLAKCSACGLSPRGFYSLPVNQIGRLPEYKFCPNCGAKMGGGDTDETP